MFFEILLFALLGIFVGIITGILPGLHPNTVFLLMFSLSFIFYNFPVYCFIVFIGSLAIADTFFDLIPSIFLGAPEPDTALSVLPGHKLLLEGRGYEALFFSVLGCFGAMMISLITFPFILYFVPLLHENLHNYIHILLLIVIFWMILSERGLGRIYAVFITILAGVFGLISLNSFSSQEVLFPALTGLFGFSTLLTSIQSDVHIPKQMEFKETRKNWVKGCFIGWLSGFFVGILPGVGTGQAGALASRITGSNEENFLTAVGSISLSNVLFSLIAFYTLGKTRSGADWVLSQFINKLNFNDLLILITVMTFSCFVSLVLTLKLGKVCLNWIKKINYKILSLIVIIFVLSLVFIFSGYIGLLISLVGTFLGLLTISMKIKRTHLMSFLILPTIFYYSGIYIFI